MVRLLVPDTSPTCTTETRQTRTRRPKKWIRIRDLYTVNPTTSLLKLGFFWPWRMSTGSAMFSFLSSGFAQIFRQIVFIRLNAIKNTNLETLWQTWVAQKRLCLSSPPAPHHKQNLYLYLLWSAEVRDDTIAAQYLSVMRVPRTGSFHGRRPKTFSPHFRLDCWESIFSFSTKINRM